MTPEPIALDRRIPFEHVFNARDLGGLPTVDGRTVRRGLVFRADGVQRLAGADLELAADLGIRTVLDLRTLGEVEHGRFPESVGATWHHVPFLEAMWSDRDLVPDAGGAVPFLRDRYLEMLVEGQASIARAVELVAEGAPVLFHCAAGKDRTGVLAAVLLSLLGVSDEDIAADYHLSADGMTAFSAWVTETYPEALDAMSSQPPEFMEAPAEAMLGFLERVTQVHGSIEQLVLGFGVDTEVLVRLRGELLES